MMDVSRSRVIITPLGKSMGYYLHCHSKIEEMGTVAEMKKTYDIVMSVHGMGEMVKLDLRTSRKNVLFLSQLLKRALGGKDKAGIEELIGVMGAEVIKDLSEIAQDCLAKGSLVDLNQKLEQL